MLQSEHGDVVNLAQPLLVPLEALRDILSKSTLRKVAATNGK
jgi:hypothetical protein